MATKTIEIAGIGPVMLVKRTGNRSLRLSVTPSGVRVSMPHWTPYSAGQAFALGHTEWIQTEQRKLAAPLLESGQRIGKMHYLRFEQILNGGAPESRVTATEVIVRLSASEAVTDTAVQSRARQAALRALRREASRLLPPRLQALAARHHRSYTSVSVKQLKRRWGSCDQNQAIALNLFLMELPWDYIDYVLLHELAHTVEMNHGPAFWRVLTAMQPRARDLAKQLRRHQPSVGTWQ